jgi:hypothetical protein
VADNLVKPIGMIPSAAAVGGGLAKQITQPLQRGIGGLLSPRPATRIPIAQPILSGKPDIDTN